MSQSLTPEKSTHTYRALGPGFLLLRDTFLDARKFRCASGRLDVLHHLPLAILYSTERRCSVFLCEFLITKVNNFSQFWNWLIVRGREVFRIGKRLDCLFRNEQVTGHLFQFQNDLSEIFSFH